MKTQLIGLFIVCSFYTAAQKPLKDFYLSHSLKQDNEQYQFKVLDEDKRGVFFFKKDRFYHWYKAQHVMATQGGASGVLLHGIFESFYSNKQLCRKGQFFKGLKDGEWLYWREDGTLIRTENWRRGQLLGTEKYYDETGTVVQSIEHRRWSLVQEDADSLYVSKRIGQREVVSYKGDGGAIVRKEERKKGKLHGTVSVFDDSGAIVESTRYKKGEVVPEKEKRVKEPKSEEASPATGAEEETRKWWQFWKKKEQDGASEVKKEKAERSPKRSKNEQER